MSTELLLAFFKDIEHRISEANTEEDLHNWIIMSVYCVLSYTISLRGNEGFLLDVKSIITNWNNHPQDYIIIGLLGRYKGENHDYTHLVPCVNQTNSGLHVKNILHRAVREKIKYGFKDGPLISDRQGLLWTSHTIDEMMGEILVDIFRKIPTLFDIRIKSSKQVTDNFKSYRSFRRSSDTRALNMKVNSYDIDVINRWSTVEKAQGRKAGLAMKHHYAEVNVLLGPFIRYTKAM